MADIPRDVEDRVCLMESQFHVRYPSERCAHRLSVRRIHTAQPSLVVVVFIQVFLIFSHSECEVMYICRLFYSYSEEQYLYTLVNCP